jgi:hypothetical protein
MKKIIIAFTTIFCINNLTFAQEFYAGLKSGFKIENYKIPLAKTPAKDNYFYQERRILAPSMAVSAPTAQALFRITFLNNLEVEASVGWYNYSQKLKARINSRCALTTFGVQNAEDYTFSTANEHTFGSVFFAPKVGYRFALSQGLHLRFNTGVQVGWLYNTRSTSNTLVESDPFELYIIYRGLQKIPINLHVSNAISLQYITKYNVYFSIFAAYHVGLFKTYESDVYLTNRRSNESPFYNGHDTYMYASVIPKGYYFEFGIELGYMWYNKKDW